MEDQTIQKIEIENVKGAKSVSIVANGIVNEIGGKNGNGKTSILDSIGMALGGAKYIDEMPLTKGEEKGSISLTLQDFEIVRNFKGEKSTLKIKGVSGGKYSQTDMNQLLGKLTFDPLEFARSSNKDKIKLLKDMLDHESPVG